MKIVSQLVKYIQLVNAFLPLGSAAMQITIVVFPVLFLAP